MHLSVSSAFDSGNIALVDQPDANSLRLRINRDAGGEFFQWFYFRVSGARNKAVTLKIVGLEESAYPGGWPQYRARISEDRVVWTQADTGYDKAEDGGTLTIKVTPAFDAFWVAYFAPYPMERHHDLLARIGSRPGVQVHVLGNSLEGQPIDCLKIGNGPRVCWMHARQHPGESMAEWWMEGALEELTDPASVTARLLRDKATLYLVPNMNPDGSCRGYLRTNAAGANLNREWASPTAERSPEVLHVLEMMKQTGVDFALDVHGDEALPHNFIAGFDGIPSVTEKQLQLLGRYKERLSTHAVEFQTKVGYPAAPAGRANLAMATNQIAERFGCLAATLEMPFKDCDDMPEPVHGWSPERAKRLAVSCLKALADIVDELR